MNISYMGTKRELAPAVADVVSLAKAGPILDVFSGMCSVGEAVAPVRQVWTNDVQHFAAAVGAALFTSREPIPTQESLLDTIGIRFRRRLSKVLATYEGALAAEDSLLQCEKFEEFAAKRATLRETLRFELAHSRLRTHDLFVSTYADTFFGVRQSIEIDCMINALMNARENAGDRVDGEVSRWILLALGRAMLRSSNSTGHFAQYLKPKDGSFRTFQRQRRRSIWQEWLSACDEMSPVGTREWRARNRAFNREAVDLLTELNDAKERPSVVYADPPYTDDQYSRFYHLLETLMLYDYPEISGAGLYRNGRFHATFSVKSKAVQSLDDLAESVSGIGADFILSYPTNGLAYQAGGCPEEILKNHFRSVERVSAISHQHSTFGASKGEAKAAVVEQIFLAKV